MRRKGLRISKDDTPFQGSRQLVRSSTRILRGQARLVAMMSGLLQRAAHHDAAFAAATGDAPAHGISRRVSQSDTRRTRLPGVALFSPDSHMEAVQAGCLCLT